MPPAAKKKKEKKGILAQAPSQGHKYSFYFFLRHAINYAITVNSAFYKQTLPTSENMTDRFHLQMF